MSKYQNIKISKSSTYVKVIMKQTFKKYRHDFSEECKMHLAEFAETNHELSRKEYVESWRQWVKTYQNLVQNECDELKKGGFEGDALDKMFKSVRYYHRKKSCKPKQPSQLPQTRTYIRLPLPLQTCMDEHIRTFITNQARDNTPELKITHMQAFSDFIQTRSTIILNELVEIKKREGSLEETMGQKIQKRYRDKFYTQRSIILNNIQV